MGNKTFEGTPVKIEQVDVNEINRDTKGGGTSKKFIPRGSKDFNEDESKTVTLVLFTSKEGDIRVPLEDVYDQLADNIKATVKERYMTKKEADKDDPLVDILNGLEPGVLAPKKEADKDDPLVDILNGNM